MTTVIAFVGVALSLLALGLELWGERAEKVRSTIDFWTSTQERRFNLRKVLPYESDSENVADFLEGLSQHSEGRVALLEYLSLFETLGTGVDRKVFDFETVMSLDGRRISEIWDRYESWVIERRAQYKKKEIYQDLQTLAERCQRHSKP